MSGNLSGISRYQQTSVQTAKSSTTKASATNSANKSAGKSSENVNTNKSSSSEVKVSDFKPLSSTSSLIPTTKKGYGTVVGDVELSDKAREYYDKLKSKFNGMDFILVSKDLKSQVAANASAYGNAARQVVLIDEEKLERMATDEAYRKKYEGIIAGSQEKMAAAKNSLVSAGSFVKNFGMSVNEDGSTSFFATILKGSEKANDSLKARQEKHKAEKAAEKKASEKKANEKKAKENQEQKRLEKKVKENQEQKRLEEKVKENQEQNRLEKKQLESDKNNPPTDKVDGELSEENIFYDDRKYLNFESSSLEALIDKVSRYVYNASENSLFSGADAVLGQSIDFRG